MPEVLTESELTTRQLYDQGCEKYGMVPFMREVNGLLREGVRVDEALRTAGAAIDRQRLEREVIEACKVEREAQKTYLENLNFINSEIHHNALIRRTSAVDALIDFESQQIKK